MRLRLPALPTHKERAMNCKRNFASALALGIALVLGGCGGGDSGSGTGGSSSAGSIPASATASVDAFVAYMKLQIAGTSETSTPVSLGSATGPTSETASPSGL